MAEVDNPAPLAPRRLIGLTLSAIVVALIILFAAVLPAEYHRDPTGLGRLTGIGTLWAPPEAIVASAGTGPSPRGTAGSPASRSFPTAFRSDVIEIPLKVSGDPEHGDEVEYKVRLKANESYIYSWQVAGVGDPEEFYSEFHGENAAPGKAVTVAYYRKATGTSDNGVLTAPFDGVHGWYFQNQSVRPVTVRLRLSGFYDLIPDGQPGNEAGFHAKRLD